MPHVSKYQCCTTAVRINFVYLSGALCFHWFMYLIICSELVVFFW